MWLNLNSLSNKTSLSVTIYKLEFLLDDMADNNTDINAGRFSLKQTSSILHHKL